jgi:hypothetical protein
MTNIPPLNYSIDDSVYRTYWHSVGSPIWGLVWKSCIVSVYYDVSDAIVPVFSSDSAYNAVYSHISKKINEQL